jgi:hypothetical protein
MFWVSKVLAPLALVAGIAITTTVVMADGDGNQPPFGKGGKGFPGKGGDDKKKTEDKKDDKKTDKKDDKKIEDKKGPVAPKSDAVVDAWLAVLLTKITDPHDTVRDSARGAVVAVGPVAIPALQKLADGDDPAKAVAARKLIGAIMGHGHGGPGGHPGMGPGGHGGPGGFPGMGPMGPGGPGGFGPPGMGGRGGPGMGPMGPGGRGGFPGMGPGGRGGPGGDRGRGPRDGRDEESEVEVAPMPRDAANR